MSKFKINKFSEGDQYIVFDELIPKQLQESILQTIDGVQSFPWYMLRQIGHTEYGNVTYADKNAIDGGGFYHSIVDDGKIISKYFDYFNTILYFFTDKTGLEVGDIMRIRLRYTHKGINHDKNKYAAPHVDFNTGRPYNTLVYYVDTSDGDTIIFDKIFNPAEEIYNPVFAKPLTELVRITPTKGSGLFFNGHRYHAGNFPIHCSSRIVINFDFEVLPEIKR
jgi:hypothetical protein